MNFDGGRRKGVVIMQRGRKGGYYPHFGGNVLPYKDGGLIITPNHGESSFVPPL